MRLCKKQDAWEEKPKTRTLHLQTEKKKLPLEETGPRSQEWSGCLYCYTKMSSEGFPGGSADKELPAMQETPWRIWTEEPGGLQSMGSKESDKTEAT